jgi:DNA mismatch repair ATPase MutL
MSMFVDLTLMHAYVDSYDVNVSPDKRSIFLHSEQNLIEALKVWLIAFISEMTSRILM